MKLIIGLVVGLLCGFSSFGSPKVDALMKLIRANEGKDLSEAEEKKIFEEVAKRQSELSNAEQREFGEKMMAAAQAQIEKETSVKNEKVDALVAFVEKVGKQNLSEEEYEKAWNEIEARENALTKADRELFKAKQMAAASKQAEAAMKKMMEIRVDTPAAKVDWFEDDTNTTESVFGVAFGTKVNKKVVSPSCDAGPLTPLINETELKIPKPVKWFTMVTGQPNERNKRIESLTFKAAIPETMPAADVERGVKQLEQLMMAKFGKDCLKTDGESRDFRVVISNSEKLTGPEEMDTRNAVLSVLARAKIPRSVTLYVENRRVGKMDPEIPQPEGGDGFADDLKIPVGLMLAEPETDGEAPKSDFRLINGSQGGIYRYETTVNPGEAGDVYLRAYEVTKGTRLSAVRMKQATRESVAGDKPQKVGKRFTIYEGDWEKYYAARIEVWFLPANGGKPRKLKEKLFRVQGWMF